MAPVHNNTRGGVLLMTMVLLGMFMVMMIAGVGLLNTQFHQTSDQEQEEKAFEVADAGVQHALWLVKDAQVDPAALPGQTITQTVTGASGASGQFSLVFTLQDVNGYNELTVISTGQDASEKKAQTIEAKIQEYDAGGGITSYYLKSWDHKP